MYAVKGEAFGHDNEFLTITAVYCGDVLNYFQVDLEVLIDSKLDVTDTDHSLPSFSTLVFDPGGSDVKDLNQNFFTMDVTMTNSKLALFLSYLEMCYIELDFYKVFLVFFSVYYLDKIATILLFNFGRKFTCVWTD